MFDSKADTLIFLNKKLTKSIIPLTYIFSISDWKKSQKNILKIIKKKFKSLIAIRSSASDEDTFTSSNAGKYSTYLNIDSKNLKLVKKRILEVIRSYGKNKSKNSKILIQEMIKDVDASGVIFNRDMSSGLNYYVINYDDISKRTDTVTSGNTKNSNRVLYIFKERLSNVNSYRFRNLLLAIKEIEEIFRNIPLDIEFVITKKLKVYILQVRPLIVRKKISNSYQSKVYKTLVNFEKKFYIRSKLWNSVYSQMSDWNPVEIIGKFPNFLSFTLYKDLILDFVWINARKLMGYSHNFKNKTLMSQFLGQPYIDVKKSFISFLPHKTPRKKQNKLINYYLQKLLKNPHLHDKIEFEIAINSFIFDFNQRFTQLNKNLLSKVDINILKDSYKKIFIKNLNPKSVGSIQYNLNKLEYLESLYQSEDYKKIKLIEIIKNTKKYGTLPFSIFARHAFIAENLLRSLERLKLLNYDDISIFKQNIETVTSKFVGECQKLSKNSIKFKDFLDEFGHLRPGTYDINSGDYRSYKKNFFIQKGNEKKNRKLFKLSFIKKKKILLLLKKNSINLNLDQLFNYIKQSIQLREYSKFLFTKKTNLILNKIVLIGKENNLTKKQLSNLSIHDLLSLEKKKIFKKDILFKIKSKMSEYKVYLDLKLPMIVKDKKDIFVIPYQISSPNFIGKKKVSSKLLYLKKNLRGNIKILEKKIVLIENADPGFDWIFNSNIKGLLTRYGGANSHMAIRCNELGIPAAIGIGDKIFEEIKIQKELQLDCKLKTIKYNLNTNYVNQF